MQRVDFSADPKSTGTRSESDVKVNCCYQAFLQACAIYSPADGDFKRDCDTTPTEVGARCCRIARGMEALKIAIYCVVAAIVYGIIHDQVTARICVQYFTTFHPPIFHTQSPTLLAIGWGIIATWWGGVFFSVPLILSARAGARPTLRALELLPSIAWLLVSMGACALLSGITGYTLARRGVLATNWLSFTDSPAVRYRFMADWWAHSASYAAAFVGGIVLRALTYRKRAQPLPGR
jgi:hypothetical protein